MLIIRLNKKQSPRDRIIQIGGTILKIDFAGDEVVKLVIEGPAEVHRDIDRFTPAGIEQLRIFEEKTGSKFI